MLCVWFGWSRCTLTSNMAEAKMWTPSRSLAAFATLFLVAFATLLMEGSMVAYAAAAEAAPGDTSPPKPPEPPKPSQCLYGDAKYGQGAVICVAPQFGQQCGKDSKWDSPTKEAPFDTICAGARASVPGVPPAQCIYHDVKYAPDAMICVAPSYMQICGNAGVWSPAVRFDPCKNAQIPAPTYPAAPAAK
jgi:hypothetical protein